LSKQLVWVRVLAKSSVVFKFQKIKLKMKLLLCFLSNISKKIT
jgi:hypothetical protein